MPPWFADPNYGHFENERRLSNREVELINAGSTPEHRRAARRMHHPR
jgi:hypothetical protein